jgi:hypothetical protein
MDRPAPIPFTECLVTDVGMGNAVVGLRRIGIERHHDIRVTFLAAPPIQSDLKSSQVDSFQHDRSGRYRNQVFCSLTLNCFKFAFQGHQVPVQLGLCGNVLGCQSPAQLVGHSAEVGLEVIDLLQQLFFPVASRIVPAPIFSELRAAGHAADAAPPRSVQYQSIDFTGLLGQFALDQASSS